jgi:hypothetical protein
VHVIEPLSGVQRAKGAVRAALEGIVSPPACDSRQGVFIA